MREGASAPRKTNKQRTEQTENKPVVRPSLATLRIPQRRLRPRRPRASAHQRDTPRAPPSIVEDDARAAPAVAPARAALVVRARDVAVRIAGPAAERAQRRDGLGQAVDLHDGHAGAAPLVAVRVGVVHGVVGGELEDGPGEDLGAVGFVGVGVGGEGEGWVGGCLCRGGCQGVGVGRGEKGKGDVR